jgi:hypothetical protein
MSCMPWALWARRPQQCPKTGSHASHALDALDALRAPSCLPPSLSVSTALLSIPATTATTAAAAACLSCRAQIPSVSATAGPLPCSRPSLRSPAQPLALALASPQLRDANTNPNLNLDLDLVLVALDHTRPSTRRPPPPRCTAPSDCRRLPPSRPAVHLSLHG